MAEARKVQPRGDSPRKTADAINDHADKMNGLAGILQKRTVAELANEPHDPSACKLFFCTNETGGAQPVFSDGTNWRRFTDRAIAS